MLIMMLSEMDYKSWFFLSRNSSIWRRNLKLYIIKCGIDWKCFKSGFLTVSSRYNKGYGLVPI